MTIKNHTFKNGLTVKELKNLINDWPEIDRFGEPTEVWIETGVNLTSPVVKIFPLSGESIELQSMAFEK